MAAPGERELGRFVTRHETDVARHGRVGIIWLPIGLVALAGSIPVVIQTFKEAASGTFAGLLLGVALLSLWSGITNGLRYLSRHGEVYILRQGGLVYRRTGETRVIPWESITEVSDRGQANAISRAMGWDVHCRIRVRTGKRLLLTGFTKDAAKLSLMVRRAVHEGVRPLPPGAA
ncbi:PH domain-containing protein [Streptomyces oryzae]|uniref:PH domain-containing protein n=1 Tax=Streptomyces oryzae TaxID=1434886 RepID=A0ABS3XD47_9ACTN|nr:PH domain-containing protein [Streptomyces oryzae]MBO8193309.1 PH domain-containing protein [Streptomyces oryzae]